MAQATITATTSQTSMVNTWKEVYTPLMQGLNFDCEEYKLAKTIPEVDVDWSAFNTVMPLDLQEATGIGAVPEGGWKTRPSSKDLVRGIIDLVHYNGSFTSTELTRWADKGNTNQVIKQLKLQGRQKVDAFKRHFSDYFWGTSVGTLALTDSDLAGGTDTLTLKYGYGSSTITNAAFIADKFRVGDWVSAVNGSSLVANAIGEVTARSTSTPSIDVTWNGAATDSTNDLKIVKANSMENTTIDGTDYNYGLVGMMDLWNTASVHSVTSGTYADWSLARSVSSGGRMNGVKYRAMKDAIENYAPAQHKPNLFILAQGVRRDMIAYERAGLRFDDAFDMEIDGDIKARGTTIFSSRRVPPGYASLGAKSALKKIALLPQPDGEGGLGWEDGEKLENRSVFRFDIDWVGGLVHTCRKAWALETGLTEQ